MQDTSLSSSVSSALDSSLPTVRSRGIPAAPLLRGVVIVVVTALSFVVARDQFHTPFPAPVSAPATEFSASRAMRHVEAVAGSPRPQGSEAAAAARDYIKRQLESLGLTPEVQ